MKKILDSMIYSIRRIINVSMWWLFALNFKNNFLTPGIIQEKTQVHLITFRGKVHFPKSSSSFIKEIYDDNNKTENPAEAFVISEGITSQISSCLQCLVYFTGLV